MVSVLAIFSSPGPVILQYGPFVLRWYGLLIAISVILGIKLSSDLSRIKGLERDLINDLFPLLVISALIGARIYYVLFEWRIYKQDLLEALAIWKGGIAIHGALIGGVLAIWFFCLRKKQYFWDMLDILVPSFALGQAIGRWGNFFNNEAFGTPSNLPWKIFIPYFARPIEFVDTQYFHPTFLYESLWNLGIFCLLISLFLIQKKKRKILPSGFLSCIYLFSYSLGRFFIEGLRIDPLCLAGTPPFCEGGIRIAQLMSIFLMILGAIGFWRLFKVKKQLPSLGTTRRGLK